VTGKSEGGEVVAKRVGEYGEGTIPNDRLSLANVPGPDASWYEIGDFALTYNGYEECGSFERCAEIANARQNESLDDLRACLFFEQRRFRHSGWPPEGEDLEYIRGLVKQIRERLGRKPADGQAVPYSRIPAEVASRLGWYVYAYVNPRDGSIFYVGKGKGQRLMAHLSDGAESRKTRTIEELREAGLKPRLDVLAHGLTDEETAFRVEAAVIDSLGLERLTNEVRGWRSVETGRMPLEELVAYYGAKPVEVTDPCLLIRINRLYRHGMAPHELYEATRGVWKVGVRREQARYALAVFEQVVREVYVIEAWHRALTTKYSTRTFGKVDGRWEFTGRVADEPIRSRYVGRSVAKYFKQGMQSPVTYSG
jgi:hypothetical protein